MPKGNGRDALLVGSLALENAEAVMTAAADALGGAIRRIPDGETGARSKFITWQVPVLAAAPQFETLPLGPQSEWGPNGEFPPRILKLRPGAKGTPEFPRTGYADAALDSYRAFARLKAAGRIGKDVRFQVGLPTPLGVLAVFMEPDAQRLAEPPYRRRLLEDIDRISAGIPHGELSIQFDVPEEIAVWEGLNTIYLDHPREAVVSKLLELMERVPGAAELGMHLCYGDISHKHWKEPDLGLMAEFANAVVARLKRPLDYVHLPIPRNWTTPAHYAKLRDFRLKPGTRVYLGLVHLTDGVEGAKRRIDAARQHLAEFGIATSCGLGRRDASEIPRILALHREMAEIA
ncbi:MAG: hypothetical protein U1F37_20395 [Alphaproteobacteria bacterium]